MLAKVERPQGRFGREQIRGADDAAIRDAKIDYDDEAGEMRLLVVVSRSPYRSRVGLIESDSEGNFLTRPRVLGRNQVG